MHGRWPALPTVLLLATGALADEPPILRLSHDTGPPPNTLDPSAADIAAVEVIPELTGTPALKIGIARYKPGFAAHESARHLRRSATVVTCGRPRMALILSTPIAAPELLIPALGDLTGPVAHTLRTGDCANLPPG